MFFPHVSRFIILYMYISKVATSPYFPLSRLVYFLTHNCVFISWFNVTFLLGFAGVQQVSSEFTGLNAPQCCSVVCSGSKRYSIRHTLTLLVSKVCRPSFAYRACNCSAVDMYRACTFAYSSLLIRFASQTEPAAACYNKFFTVSRSPDSVHDWRTVLSAP